ncbi:MAG: hypothetical protein U9M98_00930 [Patescibacteria group bacterium]|nr:hypothetical protein [Patescibacteria group bacterium]
MSFNFLISEPVNKFNFFSIQTGWHFSVKHRKRRMEGLLTRYGELSSEEDRALRKLAHLLKKHSFGKGFVGTPFFRVKDGYSYSDFERILNRGEFEDLEGSLEILDARWKRIWGEEQSKLLDWEAVFTRAFEEDVNLEEILGILGKLYCTKPRERYFVQLLISAPGSGGGGAWSGIGNVITLECGGLAVNEENKKDLMGTLFHEVAHLMSRNFQNDVLIPYLRSNDFFGFGARIKNIPTVTFFSEAIVHAFFPRGVLGRNYLGIRCGDLYEDIFEEGKNYPCLAAWGVFVAEQLGRVAGSYVEEAKALDEQFLDLVRDTLKQFLEMRRNFS